MYPFMSSNSNGPRKVNNCKNTQVNFGGPLLFLCPILFFRPLVSLYKRGHRKISNYNVWDLALFEVSGIVYASRGLKFSFHFKQPYFEERALNCKKT